MLTRIFSFCLVLFLMCNLAWGSKASAMASEDASSMIQEAGGKLDQAFIAVISAANARADVTELMAKLNAAQDLLSRANISLLEGDLENASALANQCINDSNGIIYDAAVLQSQTERNRQEESVWLTGLSIAGLIFLLIVGLVGWRFVKTRYVKGVLKMEPGKSET